jgi:hypothetical protein
MLHRKVHVHLRAPHAEQRRFIESPAPRKVIRAGRRSGKTTGAAILAVERFLQGARVLYAVPTAEQSDAFWRECKLALGQAVSEKIFAKNETERSIEKPGTLGRIKCSTAWDADTLRSDWCDLLILDEWQLMSEDTWSQVGAPLLLDRQGHAVFIYTPPSLHSRSVTKARDPRHASRMFQAAAADKTGRWAAFHFTSHANPFISRAALDEIASDMSSLAIRQEILAEDVEEATGALWRQSLIDETRVSEAPELARIVVAVDPSGSGKSTADECGIVVAGLGSDGHGYVLEDLSRRASPKSWAAAAVAAYHHYKADRIIAEANFGGEMVEQTIRTVDENVSYKSVTASRSKMIRAEPVVALYEKGLIHHVGNKLEELESELCCYVPGSPSPGRLDSVVWAVHDLMLKSHGLGLIEFIRDRGRAFLAELQSAKPMRPARNPLAPADPREPQQFSNLVSLNGDAQSLDGPCPRCRSRAVIKLNGRGHCNQCAHDWGALPAVTRMTRLGAGIRLFRG